MWTAIAIEPALGHLDTYRRIGLATPGFNEQDNYFPQNWFDEAEIKTIDLI
jgi:hypothetical protein